MQACLPDEAQGASKAVSAAYPADNKHTHPCGYRIRCSGIYIILEPHLFISGLPGTTSPNVERLQPKHRAHSVRFFHRHAAQNKTAVRQVVASAARRGKQCCGGIVGGMGLLEALGETCLGHAGSQAQPLFSVRGDQKPQIQHEACRTFAVVVVAVQKHGKQSVAAAGGLTTA